MPRKSVPFYPDQPCAFCSTIFRPMRSTTIFCSKRCRRSQEITQKNTFSLGGVCDGTVGAIAELVVSTDLMRKGWEVYRALSPASSCDVLAFKNGACLYVEVRTAQKTLSGNLLYPKKNIRGSQIALVTHRDNQVHYIPELPACSASEAPSPITEPLRAEVAHTTYPITVPDPRDPATIEAMLTGLHRAAEKSHTLDAVMRLRAEEGKA